MMPKKKPYFNNNWQAYKDADDDMFIDHTFEEFMAYKIAGWELPSSVSCVIRETTHNGKIKEHVYKRSKAAQKKIIKLMSEGASFIVADGYTIHQMFPNNAD